MRSLFWRIFLAFWAAIILTVIGVVTFTVWQVLAPGAGDVQSESLAREATAALDAGGRTALAEWVLRQGGRDDLGGIVIVEAGHSAALGRTPPQKERWLASSTELGVVEAASLMHRRVTRVTGADGATYWLLIAPRTRGHFLLPTLQRIPLVGLLAAIAASAVTAFLLARYMSSPIRKLRAATRAALHGDLGVRVAPSLGKRRDELVSLAVDFDKMAEHLRALLESRQQLMRDLSHELRSPLARLQIALGLARRPGANLAQELGRIEREAQRLDVVIGQILRLARLDDSSVVLSRERFDLRQLLDELVHDANLEACARHVQVVLDTAHAAAACVIADRALMSSAVENVLRNAIRHTLPGSSVNVVLASDARETELLIRDEGAGVPANALAHIFEPFVRLRGGSDGNADGHGLGLAITERIVRLHGGTVCARNRHGGGLEVEIRLPFRVARSESLLGPGDVAKRRTANA